MTNETDYPLTIEILEDRPSYAELMKGQICKAKLDVDGDFKIFDKEDPYFPWGVLKKQAKVIDNG